MAPRAGLEPATNGLTVQKTQQKSRGKLKNYMGTSDAKFLRVSKPEPIPKHHYDSLPKLSPKLWLGADLWLFLSWSYGKPNYDPNPKRSRNRVTTVVTWPELPRLAVSEIG